MLCRYATKGLGKAGLALALCKGIPTLPSFGLRSYCAFLTVSLLNKLTSALIPVTIAPTLRHVIRLDPGLKLPHVQGHLDTQDSPPSFAYRVQDKMQRAYRDCQPPQRDVMGDKSHVMAFGMGKSLFTPWAKSWCLTWVFEQVTISHSPEKAGSYIIIICSPTVSNILCADIKQWYLNPEILFSLPFI